MVMSVDASGNMMVRGVVQSISGDTLTVQSWGGVWNIILTGSGTVAGAPDIAGIQVGDYVGVLGTLSPTDYWTVDASYVRDWTMAATSTTTQ